MKDILITFDDLAAGDIVGEQYQGAGVTISSGTAGKPPMVFDTDFPTGGDTDLATDDRGNVLILSEDGDQSDPDDNAGGGVLIFTFDEPSEVQSLRVLDIEDTGSEIRLYDADGTLIKTVDIPVTGDGGQAQVAVDGDGVARMEVELTGSGAVDDLAFTAPADTSDGIISGTGDADTIDPSYLGDPDGDLVDSGDAVLPGEVDDDDIIDAQGGDDMIAAGDGDDEVFGGAGNDTISGGDGADLIFGDQALGGGGEREEFDWAGAPDPGNPGGNIDDGDAIGGFTQNTGTVSVTFSILDENGDPRTRFEEYDRQNIKGIEGDEDGVDKKTSLDSKLDDEDESVTYGLDFSDDVTNVAFRVNDIDMDSSVRIMAYDSNGNPVEIELTAGRKVTLSDEDGDGVDDTATSEGGNWFNTSNVYSVLVNIPGPVSRIEITHEAVGDDPSAVNITNVYYDPVEDGDDVIDGGDGDDTIFGGAGDDTLTGGDGADQISGGTGSDLFLGGNGGDVVIGGEDPDGADFDRLDLTGSGVKSITYTSDDREDGIVTFKDGSTMTFSEIEAVTPCFTPGTRIATARGERLVEELRVGDRIVTRDNGLQEIRWVGHCDTSRRRPQAQARLEPILIAKGSLGNDLPERDMLVSPNHRILVANERTELYFDEKEVLVAAKHLIGSRGIEKAGVRGVTYIHFMCDRHEVVLSDGSWTESFQPGDHSLKGLGGAQREEIYDLFPELKEREGLEGYQSARMQLKKHEARLLVR